MAFDNAVAVSVRPDSFAIKGALLPMTLLELRSNDIGVVDSQLREKVTAAPGFFTGSPVVLNFDVIGNSADEFIEAVIALCGELGFRLAGLKGDCENLKAIAEKRKLGHFPAGKVKPASSKSAKNEVHADPVIAEPAAQEPKPVQSKAVTTKTVTTPIRSGQQIFSEGDLIVLAPVSAGAELLAVGNIHVYGPMRGRALAGVQGDESARIFCMSQEAELVSIAGHFMIDENLRKSNWKVAAQIYFNGDQLQVEPIAGLFS